MNKFWKYLLYIIGILIIIGIALCFFSPKCKEWLMCKLDYFKMKINPIENEGKPKIYEAGVLQMPDSEGRAVVNTQMNDNNNLES